MDKDVRLDKYLWSVRLFKTRSMASEACKSGKVLINGSTAKASRMLKRGDVFELKKPPINFRFKVKEVLERRVGAKLVELYLVNITPDEELLKLEIDKNWWFAKRDKGTGRPTKKDRREIERLGVEFDDDFFSDTDEQF